MNKIIYFIEHKEKENSETVSEEKSLENIYIDILKFHNIYVESYVTRSLKHRIPGMEIRNDDKKVTAFFTSTADVLISESITDCSDFYQSILEVVQPFQKMMTARSNTFKNSSVEKFQEKSLRVQL